MGGVLNFIKIELLVPNLARAGRNSFKLPLIGDLTRTREDDGRPGGRACVLINLDCRSAQIGIGWCLHDLRCN